MMLKPIDENLLNLEEIIIAEKVKLVKYKGAKVVGWDK